MTVEHVEWMIAERVSLTRHTDRTEDNVVVGWATLLSSASCQTLGHTFLLVLCSVLREILSSHRKLAKQPDRGSCLGANEAWFGRSCPLRGQPRSYYLVLAAMLPHQDVERFDSALVAVR